MLVGTLSFHSASSLWYLSLSALASSSKGWLSRLQLAKYTPTQDAVMSHLLLSITVSLPRGTSNLSVLSELFRRRSQRLVHVSKSLAPIDQERGHGALWRLHIGCEDNP